MENLNAARVLMGDSLGFHIIFVMFGLTLPILVTWFEWLGVRKKDNRYIDIAKFWSKIMALLVVTGVVSGTIIALQMSLVWPGILEFGGEVIGLPFMLETNFFLVEAIFLSLYLLTWNKVSPYVHMFFGAMTAVSASATAYVITSVNSWMHKPTGFDYVDGKLVNIDAVGAMFSQTSFVQFFHSMPGYFLSASLVVAGFYAVKLLRLSKLQRESAAHQFDRVIVRNLVAFAAIMFVVSGISAHVTGQYLAKHEPVKLAAIELHRETTDNAPFVYGGIPNQDGSIEGPHVKVPGLLSILAGNSTSTVVEGYEDTPKDERPPLYIHVLFDIKLLLVGTLGLVVFGYLALKRWKPELAHRNIVLVAISVSGLIGITIVELGWMVAEIGRQPWAVRGYVKTAEAMTTQDVRYLAVVFPVAYALLFIVTLLGLRKLIRDNAKSKKGSK